MKHSFKNLSIRRKQMFIMLLTAGTALLVASAGFIAYEIFSFRRGMVENLSQLAEIAGDNSSAALLFQDTAAAQEVLNSLGRDPHIEAGAIYDSDGKLFAKYLRESSAPAPPSQRPRPGHEFREDHLHISELIRHKKEVVGSLYIRSDLTELTNSIRQYLLIVLLVLTICLLTAIGLSSLLQRLISEPILRLADMVRGISSEKDYSVRAQKESNDEFGQLIGGFNEMLDQIQARDAALQRANDQLETRVLERTQELQSEVTERRRAEAGLQQQLTRINLLNSITRAIVHRQDLESVVQVLLRQLEAGLPIDYGRVYIYDSHADTITLTGGNPGKNTTTDTEVRYAHMSLESSGFQECSKGKAMLILDTAASQSRICRKLSELELGSALAVPMMIENELFGILLTARREKNAFSSSECEFLQMLTEHVALAAHQARLHTQLRAAYDELRQTQQAIMQEERLRALGQMASGIAHDINNALCPVVVYSDVLLTNYPELSETVRKHISNIKTAGEDIAHIVSRMREFYRRREQNEALTPVDLNKLANQVGELTRPRWRDIPQARGIMVELINKLQDDLPEIDGSESELREAVTNLILNAVDAMPRGGKLTLQTSTRAANSSQGQSNPSHVCIEVSDTGIGMDEATRKRCLEPFFSTKGKRGTGLGLAMVYGIVERHHGNIEVESEPGRGTTMRLVFPIRVATHKVLTTPGKSSGKLPPLKVLCIDDEPFVRNMLKEVLEKDGHHVHLAEGGESGLEIFREAKERGKPFDAVITDLGMPYMDGRQLSRNIKNESEQTPVIMLTGWGSLMRENGDFPSQVDAVLSKPPKIADIYDTLGKVLQKSS